MTLPMRRRLQLSPIVFGVLLLAGCSTNGSPSSSAPSAVNIGLPAAFTGGTVQYGEPWFQGAQVARRLHQQQRRHHGCPAESHPH